jgi:hypothetical protein
MMPKWAATTASSFACFSQLVLLSSRPHSRPSFLSSMVLNAFMALMAFAYSPGLGFGFIAENTLPSLPIFCSFLGNDDLVLFIRDRRLIQVDADGGRIGFRYAHIRHFVQPASCRPARNGYVGINTLSLCDPLCGMELVDQRAQLHFICSLLTRRSTRSYRLEYSSPRGVRDS